MTGVQTCALPISTSTDSGATTGEDETDPAVEQYLADDGDDTSASDQSGGDDSADESLGTSQKTETTQTDTTATDEPAGAGSTGTEIPVEDDSDEDVDELKERRNANRDIPDEREDSVEVEGVRTSMKSWIRWGQTTHMKSSGHTMVPPSPTTTTTMST